MYCSGTSLQCIVAWKLLAKSWNCMHDLSTLMELHETSLVISWNCMQAYGLWKVCFKSTSNPLEVLRVQHRFLAKGLFKLDFVCCVKAKNAIMWFKIEFEYFQMTVVSQWHDDKFLSFDVNMRLNKSDWEWKHQLDGQCPANLFEASRCKTSQCWKVSVLYWVWGIAV